MTNAEAITSAKPGTQFMVHHDGRCTGILYLLGVASNDSLRIIPLTGESAGYVAPAADILILSEEAAGPNGICFF